MNSLEIGRIDRTYGVSGETYRVSVIDDDHPERESCEREAVAGGIPLPVQHRARWKTADRAATSWFVLVVGPTGKPECAFSASLLKLRALPRHFVLRVEKFGVVGDLNSRVAGITALLDIARSRSNLLRIHLELFSPDSDARRTLGIAASDLGFRERPASRMYKRTVGVDLDGSHDDVFSRLRFCARRNIKLALKSPVVSRTVCDPALVPRVNRLWSETFARSGGNVAEPDWGSLMQFCADNPGLGRFVGLFRTDVQGPESLLAISVGRFHGDHGELTYSASARPDDLKVPLAYPLLWDLLRWANDLGAQWFDVGGITDPADGQSHDAVSGITAFKRHFSDNVIDVGEEWAVDLHPVRSAMARAVTGVASWLRITAPIVAGTLLPELHALQIPSFL